MFEYHNDGGLTLELTPDNVEELTSGRISADRVRDMFGGSAGRAELIHDEDTSWDDVDPCPDGSREALLPDTRRGKWSVNDVVDLDDPAIVRIVDGWYRLLNRLCNDEALTIIQRYAALFGYQVDEWSFCGQHPSDWIEGIAVWPADRPTSFMVDEFREYWDEGAFFAAVEIESPLGDYLEESCVGLVGERSATDFVAESVENMVSKVSADIKQAKRETV